MCLKNNRQPHRAHDIVLAAVLSFPHARGFLTIAFLAEEPIEDLLAHTLVSTGVELVMVTRPAHMNAYEFVAISAVRAKQLLAGCIPRLEGDHGAATMAQMEVAAGRVAREDDEIVAPAQRLCGWQL